MAAPAGEAAGSRAGAVVLGIDVGGTVIKAVAVRGDGRITARARTPTAAHEGSAAVVAKIEAFCADLAGEVAAGKGGPVAALGLALPGVVDEAAGVARFAANIGWRDAPLGDLLSRRLGIAVAVRNDVRAAGFAEARLGAARGTRDFLLLQCGTGIAGALVLDGHPYAGAHGLGGELGHVIVVPGGASCGCGGHGCLETVASAAAVAGRYRVRHAGIHGGGDVVADAAGVVRQAAAGEPCARQVWDEAIRALATVLAWYQTTLDAELVVLGGGLAQAGTALTEPLHRELAARLTFQRLPRLATSDLGDEAGCLGAALAAWSAAGFDVSAFRLDSQ